MTANRAPTKLPGTPTLPGWTPTPLGCFSGLALVTLLSYLLVLFISCTTMPRPLCNSTALAEPQTSEWLEPIDA